MNIENRTALVTGSNRGLGRALVEGLLARGAKRVYAATRKPGAPWNDPRVVEVILDIIDPASVAAAAKVAHDVEILVNNAGVFSAGPVLQSTEAQLRGDMEVNYFGLVNAIRGFLPVLERSQGAAIVNVLSVVSLANWSTFGGYSATKAAAWSLTQSLRNELRSKGIELFASFPGMIDTDMVSAYEGYPKASTKEVSDGILGAVQNDVRDVGPDSSSQGALATYLQDPNALIRSFEG